MAKAPRSPRLALWVATSAAAALGAASARWSTRLHAAWPAVPLALVAVVALPVVVPAVLGGAHSPRGLRPMLTVILASALGYALALVFSLAAQAASVAPESPVGRYGNGAGDGRRAMSPQLAWFDPERGRLALRLS
jgi:hypothetical protein